jgi:hypothetical protein
MGPPSGPRRSLEADRRVVSPIDAAIALPPGAADGVGAHAEPHAELENARERAGRRQADHQALQDADLAVRLHDAHQPQDGGGRHKAVRVERDRKLVAVAPPLAEVAHVAGLEARIVGAPPIGQPQAAVPSLGEQPEARVLLLGDRRVAGVAEHIDVEAVTDAGSREVGHHRLEVADHPLGALVANAQQDGGRGRYRLVAADARCRRQHRGDRVARKTHDREPDGRVPEADHRPRQCGGEQHQDHDIEGVEPIRRQRDRGEPQHARDGGDDQRGEQNPAGGQGEPRACRRQVCRNPLLDHARPHCLFDRDRI